MSTANQTFAISAVLVLGLVGFRALSQSGGSITVSPDGVTATVNPPK